MHLKAESKLTKQITLHCYCLRPKKPFEPNHHFAAVSNNPHYNIAIAL
ncbi:MAG: hypothetical protein ACI9BO_002224 [Zhongshania sp.]|jgi:hypothetical protein